MILSLKGFSRLVADSAAAVQASCASLIDFSTGSVLRAFVESTASVALWLQYLIVQVWKGARLSTSSGADVDSFVEQYGLSRLPAVAATGTVVFSRFTSVTSALIPLGLTVKTADLTQSFAVVSDITNPAWNAGLNGYLFQPGVASITASVVATVPGAAGNVQAAAISLISQSTPGVDSVTNPQPLEDGADAESDDALKSRFVAYIGTLPRATPSAIQFAVESVQQGLSYALRENMDAAGNYKPGNFLVTVDDGTGRPSPTLMDSVTAAIEAVRPIGSTFSVLPPTVVPVSVSLALVLGPNGNRGVVTKAVQNALLSYIDALPVAAVLPFSRLVQIAYAADPTIQNVTQVSLNGGTADVDPGLTGVIKASVVTIN